jgi:hypothetical protein
VNGNISRTGSDAFKPFPAWVAAGQVLFNPQPGAIIQFLIQMSMQCFIL